MIAQRESLGQVAKKHSVAEGDEQSTVECCSPSASGLVRLTKPSDSRWAIMLVAFGDKKLLLRKVNY